MRRVPSTTSMPKKEKPKGEYRNIEPMEGKSALYQFEVKTKSGWRLLTNLGGETDAIRKTFAQNTADAWIKKEVSI